MLINYIRSQRDAYAHLFWSVCVSLMWFSARSYPIITVCAQPQNKLPFALLIQMYVCVWERLEGWVGGLWQSGRPGDKGSGQICPADMEEFISITNVLNHSTKTTTALFLTGYLGREGIGALKKTDTKNNLLLWFAWRLGLRWYDIISFATENFPSRRFVYGAWCNENLSATFFPYERHTCISFLI